MLVGKVSSAGALRVLDAIVPDTPSQAVIKAGRKLETDALNPAAKAFVLALLRLTNTIEAKIPIIAITIKSSIRVKPFSLFVFIFFTILSSFFIFYFYLKSARVHFFYLI